MPKPNPDKIIFTFTLTAREAQNLFNVQECMKEEPAFREIWKEKKHRAQTLGAMRKYNRQLNKQYAQTGVEV